MLAHAAPQAVQVGRGEVAERARHRQRFLRAEQPPERPLSVELHHGFGRRRRHAPLRYDPLTGVVTLLRAGPEEEAAVEGCVCSHGLAHVDSFGAVGEGGEDVRIGVLCSASGPQFSRTQI